MAVKHVAEFYGLGWDAVKAIDKTYLEATLGEPDLSDLTVLAMDEFAIKRGHRYATIFVEPQRKEIRFSAISADRALRSTTGWGMR